MAHIQEILLATLALIFISTVSGEEETPLIRHARQYRYQPPFEVLAPATCVQVQFASIDCGGFTSGSNGGCNTYCYQQGYPDSSCGNFDCLCHSVGQGFANNCKFIDLSSNYDNSNILRPQLPENLRPRIVG